MAVTIMKELNPYFEILGLLYDGVHQGEGKEDQWKKWGAAHGVDPEEVIRRIGPAMRKYHGAFAKYSTGKEMADFDFFFSHEEPEFILFFQSLCGGHREWFGPGSGEISREEIQTAFLQELLEDEKIVEPPSLEEMLAMLEKAGYSGDLGWKILLFLQSPTEKLEHLAAILQANLPAFEKAWQSVEKQLEKRLEDFGRESGNASLNLEVSGDMRAFPTLVYPGGEVISSGPNSTDVYIGLFVKDIYKMAEKGRRSRKQLLPVLKALGDSSKFEILQALLTAPKYNLELAEELKLSAPTMSHHMSALLENGLVNVEKREGKVYYTLSKERIRETAEELERVFSLR